MRRLELAIELQRLGRDKRQLAFVHRDGYQTNLRVFGTDRDCSKRNAIHWQIWAAAAYQAARVVMGIEEVVE